MSEPDTPERHLPGPEDGAARLPSPRSRRPQRPGPSPSPGPGFGPEPGPEPGPGSARRDTGGGLTPHHIGPGEPQVPTPHQLPPLCAHFVDRSDDLRALDAARAAHPGTSPRLLVVSGIAGVGKTTLVTHWLHGLALGPVADGAQGPPGAASTAPPAEPSDPRAHAASHGFPGGQLHADLGAHAPSGPARPEDVLEHFLRSLGAPGIPAGLAERAALWRTLTAELPVAVLLDNAATAAQVRALLPGSPGSLVTVTSRSQLSGLLVDGAVLHQLSLLSPEAAVELLSRAGGGARTGQDPQAAIDVVTLCACLPLAVRLAAAQLAGRPERSVAALAAALSRGRGPLDTLRAEGRTAVKAALDESYRLLPSGPAATYRRLGPLPTTSYDPKLVAAVRAGAPEEAAADLAALARVGLLEDAGEGVYRFHDLVRAHALRTGEAGDSVAAREENLRRYGDWCLSATSAAEALLTPGHAPEPPGRAHVHPPAHPAHFTTEAEALAWLDTERDSLMHMLRHASAAGWDTLCWQLADAMWPLFSLLHPTEAWIEAHELGLAAARRDGSRQGEGRMLASGGDGLRDAGRYEEAAEWYKAARREAVRDDDPLRQAQALHGLGNARLRLGQLAPAEEHFTRAIALREAAGHRREAALSRIRLGEATTLGERYDRAAAHLARAHTDLTAEGAAYDAARALALLGQATALDGDRATGVRQLRDAHAAFTVLAARRWQVRSLEMLGRLAQAARELPEARALYEEARRLSRTLSPAETRRLEERLREL